MVGDEKQANTEGEGGEMDDKPQDRTEDRRRRGPLGDEEGTEETRRVPQSGAQEGRPDGEDTATRRVPPEDAGRQPTSRAASSQGTPPSREPPGEEETQGRVTRTPGPREDTREEEAMPYTRDERLRDVYGGVDWLASFIGCVFALVCGTVLLLLVSGLVLGPLGFTLDLGGRELDTVAITGLAIVGFILFLAFFVGGYVAGRLVRFDGGRNGAATVGWGVLLSVIFAVFGFLLTGLVPGVVFDLLRDLQNGVLSVAGNLVTLGLVGAGIVVGALLLMLLGGYLGGRFGNHYHARIDQAS
jgi:hypothetical protein